MSRSWISAKAVLKKRSTKQAAPRPGIAASPVPAAMTLAPKSKAMRNALQRFTWSWEKASNRILEGLAILFLVVALRAHFNPQPRVVTFTTRIGQRVVSSLTATNEWVQIQWHTNFPRVYHTWKTNKVNP